MNKKQSLADKLAKVKDHISDATHGLPEEVFEFVTTLTPMVNVDLLIKDVQGRILLAWRNDEICGTGWHIPGGIIRYKEKSEERVQRTALKEFGCKVTSLQGPTEIHEVFMPQEMRGHFISLLYECSLPEGYVIPKELLWEAETAKVGALKWHDSLPELVRGQKEVYTHIFSLKGK